MLFEGGNLIWLRRMKIIKIEEEYQGELVDEHGDEPENYII